MEKEISKVDGVLNLIEVRVFNITERGYSDTQIGQSVSTYYGDGEGDTINTRMLVDLDVTDGILYNDGDSMMEIKNPAQDIRVRLKER